MKFLLFVEVCAMMLVALRCQGATKTVDGTTSLPRISLILRRKGVTCMCVTWADVFGFVIMLCTVISLVKNQRNKK